MSNEVQQEPKFGEGEKRVYSTPSLTELGNVAELVRGNAGKGEDGGWFMDDTAS